MAKVEIIELLIDETKEEMGINAVSVVESPAIEENFIALQKHEVELKEVDTEKRILMGAALIPNKQIYRKNKDKEFYIYFSEDTVRKASELFLMRSNQNNATYEHERKMLEGMSVVESWIIEDEKTDKSKLYGFSLPKGTWMISMKVNNDEVWKKVKDGEVKGFSIEGYFVDKYDMSKNINEMDTIEKLKELIRKHDSETKLGKHEVELQIEQISDLKNQAGSLYKEMTSKGEQYKKEYYSKTAALEKPFNQLRAKIYTQSQEFLTKTNQLGIDGKSTTPYKEMIKLIDSMDKQSEYFNKEYVKQ